jgi:uncharacterized UBP type Zn finger protein
MSDQDKQEVMSKDEWFQDGVRPQIFKALIGKGHPEFSTG